VQWSAGVMGLEEQSSLDHLYCPLLQYSNNPFLQK